LGEKRMELKEKMKEYLLIVIIMMMIITMQPFIILGNAQDAVTVISVSPELLTVGPNETFTVSISCVPSQPMKSFELCVSFDADIIKATTVTQGDIFDGHNTFFNEGSINHSHGKITSIYSLILGPGNVSTQGDLVEITFTTYPVEGNTEIELFNVGITNETTYLPITLLNGSIIVEHTIPFISDVILLNSEPIDTDPSFGWFNFSCIVDDALLAEVFLLLHHPDGSQSNSSMIKRSEKDFFLNLSGLSSGSYSYSLYIADIIGDHVYSDQYFFVVPPNWDITMSGSVTILDLLSVSNHYGQMGNLGWIREDVNNDGIIDMVDLSMVSDFYRQEW
jgi:hypothetical protein